MKTSIAAIVICLALCSAAVAQGLHIKVVAEKPYTVRGRTVLGGRELSWEVPMDVYEALPVKNRPCVVETTRYVLYVVLPGIYGGQDLVLDDGDRHKVKLPGNVLEKFKFGLQTLRFGLHRVEEHERIKALNRFKKELWPHIKMLGTRGHWEPKEDLDAKMPMEERLGSIMRSFAEKLGDPIEKRTRSRSRSKSGKGEGDSDDGEKEIDWSGLKKDCDTLIAKLRRALEWARAVDVRKGRQIKLFSGNREIASRFLPKDLHKAWEKKKMGPR
jgi:hypothetical protein